MNHDVPCEYFGTDVFRELQKVFVGRVPLRWIHSRRLALGEVRVTEALKAGIRATSNGCALGSACCILHGAVVRLAELQTTLRDAFQSRHEVLEAYLFGSQARGEAAAHSDVDVAVFVDVAKMQPGPFGYEAALAAHLMPAIGTNALDVVVLNQAPPLLYGRVLREGIRLLSRDPAATTTREAQALSRYFDFLPQLAKIDAAVSKRWSEGRLGQ